jgi:hypothetical protein
VVPVFEGIWKTAGSSWAVSGVIPVIVRQSAESFRSPNEPPPNQVNEPLLWWPLCLKVASPSCSMRSHVPVHQFFVQATEAAG